MLAPLVYRSPVFNDIDSSFHGTLSYILNDTPKIIINYPVKNVDYTSSGLGLIINLYGQENNKKYLLGSNFWSGVGIYFPDGANPARFNDYEMITSFNWSGTNIKLNCEFQ